MLEDATLDALRTAVSDAGFTPDGAYELLGERAHRALGRNQVVPALQATRGDSPLATLLRLFSLQVGVERPTADACLGGTVDALVAAGMLAESAGEVRARFDLRPYGDGSANWWVFCDPTPGLGRPIEPMDPQFVLGISEASSSLAQLTLRAQVGRALDLGTGCGVQALHLAGHARQVVATDVNPRALEFARLTSRLNRVPFDVRDGSLFDPVGGEAFDLIVTNPPFVISPPNSPVLIYRDSPMAGDEVVRHIVTSCSDYLNPSGWCQILANWAIHRGRNWRDELASWVDGHSLDTWVLQREQIDPSEYVEMWLTDAGLAPGEEYTRRYDEWLTWFDAEGVTGVGFGWFNLRKTDEQPMTRFEEWAGPIAPPIGPAIAAWGRAAELVRRTTDAELRDLRLIAAPMAQETIGAVGAADPERIVLHLRDGVQRARQVDTVEAALVGACDGELTVGQILTALSQLLGRGDIADSYLDSVRDLLLAGYLSGD